MVNTSIYIRKKQILYADKNDARWKLPSNIINENEKQNLISRDKLLFSRTHGFDAFSFALPFMFEAFSYRRVRIMASFKSCLFYRDFFPNNYFFFLLFALPPRRHHHHQHLVLYPLHLHFYSAAELDVEINRKWIFEGWTICNKFSARNLYTWALKKYFFNSFR